MMQREYSSMIPSHSWSVPKAVDTGSYCRDRTDNINADDSIGSFGIEGLILDRSISAPPPSQSMSLTPDDKSWPYSGDLSLSRATWRDTTDSLYHTINTWEHPSRAREEIPSRDYQLYGKSIEPLSSLHLISSSSMGQLKYENRRDTAGISRSEPTLIGSSNEMNSTSLLDSSQLNITRSPNKNVDDPWNQYGTSLRRPASTGIIGRNTNKEGQYSALGDFHNSTGNPIVSTALMDGELRGSNPFNNQGLGQALSPGMSLNAIHSVGRGHVLEQVTGPETGVDSSVFYSKEYGNMKNPHYNGARFQRSEPSHAHSSYTHDIDQNQAMRVDTYNLHHPPLVPFTQGHPLPDHNYRQGPPFPDHNTMHKAESRLPINQSQQALNPIYSLDGRNNRHAFVGNVSDSHMFHHHSNPGMVILNPTPPGYENANMYRAIIPAAADHHAYYGSAGLMSSHHGQVPYADSNLFTSNIPMAQQQHFYSTAALPMSLHNGGHHATSPTYAYLVVQPQQQSSIFLSPHGEGIHITQSPGNGHVHINTSIAMNHDNILSSMQHLSVHGRPKDEHERLLSMDKSKRTKANRNSLIDSTKTDRSSLLEEFRNAKNQTWTSFTIKGHIAEFAQDQNGSRFIQQRLEVADKEEKDLLLEEILISIHRIRNDVFGNYVIQKLFELGTSDIKSKLKQTLVGDVLSLSKTMYGCRVVQKALESLDNEDLPALIHEFKGSLIECILDPNGNHVVQKCIEVLSVRAKTADNVDDSKTARFLRQNCQFIFDTSLESLSMLSCHPFGCRVIQRIIENSVEPNFTRVLDTIAACHTQLLDDQYGNYVIQHLLQYGRVVDKETIMHTVLDSGLVKLSRQKYASNVVEKLLKYGTPTIRGMIIKDMLKEGGAEDGTAAVLLMVRDAYANYVVQTALDVAPEGHIKRHFVQELSKHSSQLRNYTFAKHIVSKLGS